MFGAKKKSPNIKQKKTVQTMTITKKEIKPTTMIRKKTRKQTVQLQRNK